MIKYQNNDLAIPGAFIWNLGYWNYEINENGKKDICVTTYVTNIYGDSQWLKNVTKIMLRINIDIYSYLYDIYS